jgi:phenylacetic acid degradation operon negative regulatory protein
MSFDSTRTLLFGIFVLAGRRLTATQVIALARPLGISATNVKSHLTRMVAEGALRRSGPPRRALYWPSPSQATVVEGIHARLEEVREEPWDHTWLVLTLRLPSQRAQRERLQALLWFDGFRPLASGTFIRPAWPEQWALSRARQHLARAPGWCVRGTLLGRSDVIQLSVMYGLDSLDRAARRLARQITHRLAQLTSHRRIRKTSPAGAFASRLKVGGMVARLVGHDPRLPAALWGGRTGMRDLVRAFRRFDARTAPMAQRFLENVARTAPSS